MMKYLIIYTITWCFIQVGWCDTFRDSRWISCSQPGQLVTPQKQRNGFNFDLSFASWASFFCITGQSK